MRFSSLFGFLAAGTAIALTSGPANAQVLADLQPGRNFTGQNNFGGERSENIDPGDVDNDGDMDAGIANGGDGAAAPNRLFINMGGLQAGAIGTFNEQTSTRFAGVPIDTSRDIEFVDVDADNDLDVYIGNRGGNAVGEVSRFYTNKGGLQAGTLGFFQEDSNLRWGTLVSVPVGDQVFGGNAGPWRDWTCDCDFGDIDDDGDTDLFHSGYGPNINATRDSRIFMNTGAGIFNEFFPWANPGADIKTHTIDFDLADIDGDFDLDVTMSSRDSQARVYMNNSVNPISGSLYQDTTQFSLLALQVGNSGNANYESEYHDVDGDGDFDVWMKNYNGFTDRLFRNNGFTPGSGTQFTQMNGWIKNDPIVDENEIDFIDYDNDGDLDAYAANFSGTNFLYQSGLAQGQNFDVVGLYHRTGVGAGLAPNPELPSTLNAGTTLDGDAVDVDNDGDEDIMIANDNFQPNVLQRNTLGVPDTHAPTFHQVTTQADKANGTPTVIHAAIRDNSAYYLTNFYPASLVYQLNGGAAVSVPMFHQGSMQFRGVIPAQVNTVISYHVEVEDLAGNSASSGTVAFNQGTPSPWTNIGFGLAGITGIPALNGTGTLVGGQPLSIDLTNARPSSTAGLFVSLSSVPVNFHGGQIAAFPILAGFPLPFPTGAGSISIPAIFPMGLNGFGIDLYFQYAIQDAAAIEGFALSNALKGDVP